MGNVDYIWVGRTAHELQERMGWAIAPKYAARQAAQALADGMLAEHEFWRAVELCLTPRSEPSASATHK